MWVGVGEKCGSEAAPSEAGVVLEATAAIWLSGVLNVV